MACNHGDSFGDHEYLGRSDRSTCRVIDVRLCPDLYYHGRNPVYLQQIDYHEGSG